MSYKAICSVTAAVPCLTLALLWHSWCQTKQSVLSNKAVPCQRHGIALYVTAAVGISLLRNGNRQTWHCSVTAAVIQNTDPSQQLSDRHRSVTAIAVSHGHHYTWNPWFTKIKSLITISVATGDQTDNRVWGLISNLKHISVWQHNIWAQGCVVLLFILHYTVACNSNPWKF